MNYEKYIFTKKEKIKYYLIAVVLMCVFAYLFYKSPIAVIFMLPIGILYIKNTRKALNEKRRFELQIQFKDALLAASAALQAGYSVENSFVHAYSEMTNLYGEKAYICRELKVIINNINLNIPIEEGFYEFAKRAKLEDINTFTETFVIAKRCGGDLVKIIKRTAEEISDKADIKSEINTLISAKKFEQKIMNLMPLIIILYVNTSTGGMINSLYANPLGIVVMSVCLTVYGLAFFWAKKIVSIEV